MYSLCAPSRRILIVGCARLNIRSKPMFDQSGPEHDALRGVDKSETVTVQLTCLWCCARVLVPAKRRFKLGAKATRSKAYLLWNPLTGTILVCRDVHFVDGQLGIPTTGLDGRENDQQSHHQLHQLITCLEKNKARSERTTIGR
jgi:hypothetical protein